MTPAQEAILAAYDDTVRESNKVTKRLNGRRYQRAELQASWHTYTPREPGTPFTRRDLEDASDRASAEAGAAAVGGSATQPVRDGDSIGMAPSAMHMRGLLARWSR